MPTVNIYQNSKDLEPKLVQLISGFKKLVAKKLSGESIELDVDEISIRIVRVSGDGMSAKVEVEINAAAFEERVKNQDEICLSIQKYLIEVLDIDVKVWLILSELGHSWQNT